MKHYSLNEPNRRSGRVSTVAAKSAPWSVGTLALVGAALAIALMVYFDSSETSDSANQSTTQTAVARAPGQLVASQAAAGAAAGPDAQACQSGRQNPFAGAIAAPCDATPSVAQVQPLQTNKQVTEERAMLDSALSGNADQFAWYSGYSRNCREMLAAKSAPSPECAPSVLAANDARFVEKAQTLAAAGDTQAQFALGQFWLAVAMIPGTQEPVAASQAAPGDEVSNGGESFAQPANSITLLEDGSMPVAPAFQAPNVLAAARKAAYFFSQAAPSNPEAKQAYEFLQQNGIRASAEADPELRIPLPRS